MLNLLLFFVSLFLVIKSADSAILYSSKLATSLKLSKHIVGFLIVAAISVLPETLISIQSALQGIPSFGVGTLFGSNVADLSLVFVLVLLFAGKGLKVESKTLKDQYWYFLALAVPLALGYNGYYSRLEGLLLILTGLCFHVHALNRNKGSIKKVRAEFSFKTLFLLLASMVVLLVGSHFTVESGVALADTLNLNPALVGMFIVGLGTTLPETLFAIKAARHHYDSLALGDILGTVLTDATIVVGLVALIKPFAFDERLVHLTGLFMLTGAVLLFTFMQSGRKLEKKEGIFLFVFYALFVFTEFITGK
ncbi:MAG: hypothetical protein WC777_01880 [Candidatus Gracilibacteria bacterium]|jgi:cation:H+ antiporter